MKSSKFRMLLYVAAGIFFFVFWLVWVFPTDALKSRILTEIENQTQGRYKFDVGSLDKGHTEGLEPNVTEALVKLIVAAPGGKI